MNVRNLPQLICPPCQADMGLDADIASGRWGVYYDCPRCEREPWTEGPGPDWIRVLVRSLWALFVVSCGVVSVTWLAWGVSDDPLLIPAVLLATALTVWYLADLAAGGRP